MKIVNYTEPDQFSVKVNDTALSNDMRTTRAEFIMSNDTWVEYPVPPELLKVGYNGVEIVMEATNPQMGVLPVLTNVEIVVQYS